MTVATVRPAATIKGTGSTIVGGSPSYHAALADDTDATYLTTHEDQNSKIRFAGLTLPVGAIVDHVTLLMRMRCAGPPISTFTSLNDRYSGQFIPQTGAVFLTKFSSPIADWSVQSVAAGIALTWNASGGDDDLAAAYLEITYFLRPTVSVTAPIGSIDSARPEITWDTTAALGQTRWQTKVFSQDQYTAPGFNATDSAALIDSGVRSGNASSYQSPNVNLTNGITYRFYVRVAQQVGAVLQWSTWEFSTASMNVPVPPVPTVTAEPDDTLARIKIVVDDGGGGGGGGGGTGYGLGPYGSGPYGGNEAAFAFADGTWQFVTIERTADGGTTWTPVRSATHAAVFGATFTIYDYEACNGIDVQYRAQAIAATAAGDVASDWSALTAPVHWTSLLTWLKSPTLPAINTPVYLNEIPTLKRRNPQGVIDIPNRSDPVVVSSGRKLTEGTITFAVDTDELLAALFTLLNRAETLLLQTPPQDHWGCRYVSIGDVDENRIIRRSTASARLVVCPFVEVLAPVGDIGATGTTWEDVIGRYATWTDLLTANASWAQLLGQ